MKGFRLLIALVIVAVITFISMFLNVPLIVFVAETCVVVILDICILAKAFKRNATRKTDKAKTGKRNDRRKKTHTRSGRYTK